MVSLLLEWFWFLLPVAALSGWYIGTRKKSHHATWTTAPEYISSLNDLLNQKTSKAIDALIKFFEVNATTVDTHVLLGNLFREKGELEKATKIHQNIVSESNISAEIRITAMLELGRDYLYAGLLNKAEEVFTEVTKCDSRSAACTAHRNLCIIYEQEKSWEKAITSAQYLKSEGDSECRLRITHYQNELAEECLVNKDYKEAKRYVSLARSAEPILRTIVVDADIEFMRGNHATAMHLYSSAFSQWPSYAQFILPKLKSCFSNADHFASHLRELMPQVMTTSYIAFYMTALFEARRLAEAEKFASRMIEINCVPIAMLRLFAEHSIQGKDVEEGSLMPCLINALKSHRDDEGYLCSDCGFKSLHLYWHCPSCHAWDRVQSLDVIEPSISKSSLPSIH